MRKLVIGDDKKTITLDEINNESLVGVDYGDEKVIVVNTIEGYVGVEKDLDSTESWSETSIQKYVNFATKRSGATEVFVFENHKEMFDWLIKEV